MLIGKAVHAVQLDDDFFVDHQIGRILANHDLRQIRFPFVCIRVHPWPNCMSGARWVKISEKLLPGHGCTRILLSSYFVDTTLVVEWRHNQRILRSRSSKTAWRTLRATA